MVYASRKRRVFESRQLIEKKRRIESSRMFLVTLSTRVTTKKQEDHPSVVTPLRNPKTSATSRSSRHTA